MAYHLKFVDSPPTLELSVPEETWDALRIEIDVSRLREIRDYLDGKAVWVWTRGHAGFGRCGTIERKDGVVHARFRLFARSVRNTVLTLSFLFDALYPMNRDDEFFLVHTSCGRRHPVWGYVSGAFRERLAKLSLAEQDGIARDMRAAFRSVTSRTLWRIATRNFVSIDTDAKRFILACWGDACDVAIYPDCLQGDGDFAEFSSHNLDSPIQQATLLAGLASLCERVRRIDP